ncbi:uncharacterized protein [Phaseolus vulgaris]|uniref:uncharacterized protein n=1 Tax=Phaseolus vulgaris TaxID=3885 RepID=UPI0035CC9F66
MSYTNAFDVLFKSVNMHLVATSPIVNKVAKLWCLSVPNLVQNFLVNDQFISVTCRLEDKSFSFAGVYGATTYLSRRFLWRDLSFFTGPWCILGDFNVVLSADDCKGGVAPNQVSCNEFLNWINTNDLSCMPFTGSCYTWCNGRRGLHRIHRRLDRALCNGVCLDEWESCSYQVLVKNCSNHSPIIASLASNSLRKVNNFRFFSMWLQDTSCLKLIHDSWANQVVGCPMFILQLKLKMLKLELRDWNKNSFGNVHNGVLLKQDILLGIQKSLETASLSDSDRLFCQEKIAKEELDHALHYFIGTYIPAMVSSEENMINSAPGPDGFGGVFYHSCWEIIGTDVCNAVQQIFKQNWVLPGMNSNVVSLIPKVQGADSIKDYKPIVVANFKFKIISKILADRLALVAARIISPNQYGFVQGRQIQDCFGIAFEAINLLSKKGGY